MNILHLRNRRILVVEDDYLIAEDLRHDLEQAGAIVVGPVPSVDKALRLLDANPAIDAAVLDVNLNGERSFPVAERLEAKAIPFLFATGYDLEDIQAQWRHVPVVTKPLQIALVARLLEQGRPA
ncbi:response regulator [Paracoccus sp. YIM 132242]|uniref:Response regulator n=1 Tax=Paracoccus lichenicola TaxID=2665644 RepID=A0A6L6HTR6_9RHOB|nr:response regulator [Paracoccus lichenicola]MTE01603.1 response regulator [Paracoccus lichenicola]